MKNFISFKNIDDEKIEKLVKVSKKGVTALFFVFLLTLFLLSNVITNSLIYTLAIISFINLLSRYFVISRFKYLDKKKWLFFNAIGILATSTIWGISITLIFSNPIPEKYRFILLTILLGIAASAITTLGFIYQLYIIFIIPIFSPIIIFLLKSCEREPIILAILTITAVIYFIKGAYGYNDSFSQIISKNRSISEQRGQLQQQAKLAMLGEMLGSISHQWKQPLNTISINIQSLKYDFEDQLIDEDFIDEFILKNQETIYFMSETMEDFKNFFKIDKEKKDFSIRESINATIRVLNTQLINNNITINISGEDFIVNGIKGEFQQVILNIVNNAKDALIKNKIKKPQIEITLNKRVITIKDNANGIPQEIIEDIFNPYFTTKKDSGTGIGLYISKMIIEKNMNGLLSVKNIDNGAEFKIELT